MLQATVDLGRQRRWRATAWLMIGLAIKPIMAVLVLLVCVQYPSMIGRIAAGTGVLVGMPLALAPLGYVVTQYRDCAAKLARSSQPNRYFEDLRGLLWTVGVPLSHSTLGMIRLLAAAGTAALCLRMRRRWTDPAASAFLFCLAGVYLMLFNPRTQPNSYVIVAPAAAVSAALLLLRGSRNAAVLMTAAAACWCGSAIPPTALWLKPLTAALFGAVSIRELIIGPTRGAVGRLVRNPGGQ